jgi:quercetin 2,3-dioxygenase
MCVVLAGNFEDRSALPPPPNSWAADPSSHLAILFLQVQPGGSVAIPPVLVNGEGVEGVTRTAYFVEGSLLLVGSGEEDSSPAEIRQHCAVTLKSDMTAVLSVPASSGKATEVLILQGRVIGEPVVQHGPFVMNSQQEIQQAFADYRRTEFGGWPWSEDGPVFPLGKGRFSLLGGREDTPPEIDSMASDGEQRACEART